MKLNLSKNFKALLFLSLLNTLSAKAGSNFKRCIDNDTIYNRIASLADNVTDKSGFCFDLALKFYPLDNGCPANNTLGMFVWCDRINHSVFCTTTRTWQYYPIDNGGLCGGTLESTTLATSITKGDCPKLDNISNTLNVSRTTPNFSWICCDSNSCTVPNNVVLNGSNVNTSCVASQSSQIKVPYTLVCFNDNGGWWCTGDSGDIRNIWQPLGSCVLQVSNVINNYSTLSPPPNFSKSDLPKIIIPIAGGSLIIAAATGYYCYKKRKNVGEMPEVIESESEETHEIVSSDKKEATAHEIVLASSSQSQSTIEIENKQLKEEIVALKQKLEVMEQNQSQEARIQVPPK